MASSRYETHYGFLWPPVVMTLTTDVFMAYSRYENHVGLFLWPPVVMTLTTAYISGHVGARTVGHKICT